jgi:hypothetical protein
MAGEVPPLHTGRFSLPSRLRSPAMTHAGVNPGGVLRLGL